MKKLLFIAIGVWCIAVSGCAQQSSEKSGIKSKETAVAAEKTQEQKISEKPGESKKIPETKKEELKKITLVELGSVRCIPCIQMQPLLEEVTEKYGDQVEVVFYDVWTPEGAQYGRQYRIRLIPTQVFLDREGNEYYRHEGFLPYEDIVKRLKEGGVDTSRGQTSAHPSSTHKSGEGVDTSNE